MIIQAPTFAFQTDVGVKFFEEITKKFAFPVQILYYRNYQIYGGNTLWEK